MDPLLHLTAEMQKPVCKSCPLLPITLLSKKLLFSYVLVKQKGTIDHYMGPF